MSQIRKGFIAANAIDGSKLKLLNNEAIRAAQADGADVELMKLDGSNVLQFLKMPQVSADPSQGNDVARKSYVDAQVSAAGDSAAAGLASEQSARESADSGLQSAINAEKGRIDAILSAATADADSFAEIVNLINSVDTESDSAFGSYVISNNAALAQESADRAAGDASLSSDVADEASARQSADTALQGNLDQEVSDRQAAVSSEASARQSADNALQATIDALDVNDLGSVNITSAADGDLWQFDLESGKWVNIAPLSESGTSPSTETLYLQQTASYFDGSQSANPRYLRGMSFYGNGEPVSKIVVKLKYNSGSGTVKFLLMDAFTAPPLAVSSEVDITTITPGQMVEFTFSSPATLEAGARYYAEIFLTGGDVGMEWNQGPETDYAINYFWYDTQDGGSEVGGAWTAAVYTGSPGATATGVIKTNSSGLLDDSFVSSAIARVSDMDASDSTLQSNLDSESSARQSADGTLQSNIDSEVGARQAAVSSEQTARENADAGLQSQIDALDSGSSAGLAQEVADRQAADSAEQTAREAADSAETAARQAADAAEQSAREAADSAEATARQSADATLQGNIDSEAASRQSADTTLQGNIDTEKARIDAILTASSADKDSFAEIVNLINSVDTENDSAFGSYVVSNNAALAQEVSDRQAAVSAEEAARQAADSAETAARQAADTSLQGEVDAVESALAQEVGDRQAAVSAEQSARESADSAETSARQAADSAEQTAREAADSALDVRVDALEAVTSHKEKIVLSADDASNGYIDLAVTCKADSEMVFIGSLYVHDGDDYTVSTTNNKTRIFFAGPLAAGGVSQLVTGDVVYVRYMK